MSRNTLDFPLFGNNKHFAKNIGKLARLSIALMMSCQMMLVQFAAPACAQQVPTAPERPGSSQPSTATGSTPAATPSNLDLSSSSASYTANISSPVNINVGGSALMVSPGQMLTPAQYAAVTQVLNSGNQSIVLNANGAATGGNVHIESFLSSPLQNLVIPSGVTALQNVGLVNSLNLTGNLTNAGTLQFFSNNPAANLATINANNIFNTGLITSMLPVGGIAGANNAISNLGLNINAVNQVFNSGTISSAANLNIVAGGAVTNAANAAMTAMQNVNITSMIGNITNMGNVTATMGNINLASAQNSLMVNNIGGTLTAMNGAINIRDMLFDSKANLDLIGGNWLSKELNLFSGKGSINVDVDQVLGTVNAFGHEAHITAASPNLALGNIELGGDPTFYNRLGDVTVLLPLIYPGQAVALVAKGDVNFIGLGSVDTSSSTGNGGEINVIAGADFSVSGLLPPLIGLANTNRTLTINGASSTGGNINGQLSLVPNILNSSSSASNGSGGNIQMIAFANHSGDKGNINLNGFTSITSGGNGTGHNGNVTAIAGGTCGTSIDLGKINTTGGTPGTGNILLVTAQPTLPCESVKILNGLVTSGTFDYEGLRSADIRGRSLTTDGADISVYSGHGAKFDGNIKADGSNGADGGNIYISTSNSTGPFTVGGDDFEGSGVTGYISANGSGCGDGGSITIKQSGHGSYNVLINSLVEATSQDGRDGRINMSKPGSSVTIEGPGSLNGRLVSQGDCVEISLQGKSQINAWEVRAKDGNLSVSLPNECSTLTVDCDRTMSASRNVFIDVASITNNGTIKAGQTLAINHDSGFVVDGRGTLRADTIKLTSDCGDVDVSQGRIYGTVKGHARKDFEISAECSGLKLNDITARNITAQANGGDLRLVCQSDLTAKHDIVLRSSHNIIVGDDSTLTAGQLNEGFEVDIYNPQILQSGSVRSNGSITLDTYLGGKGYGNPERPSQNIQLGSRVTMTTFGGKGNSGEQTPALINLHSLDDIVFAGSDTLSAWGGNVVLNAGGNAVLAHGNRITAVAKLSDDGGIRTLESQATVPNHTGGGIAILAGMPEVDAVDLLSNMSAARNGSNTIAGANLIPGNSLTSTNGGSINVSLSEGSNKELVLANWVTADGGTIFLDPPSGHQLFMLKSILFALGPAITPYGPPTPPEPPTPPVTPVTPGAPVPPNTPTTTQPKLTHICVSLPEYKNYGFPKDQMPKQNWLPGDEESACSVVTMPNPDKDRTMMFTVKCQSYSGTTSGGPIVMGTPGTTWIRTTQDSLSLKDGKMLVFAATSDVTVNAGGRIFTVPRHAISIIEKQGESATIQQPTKDSIAMSDALLECALKCLPLPRSIAKELQANMRTNFGASGPSASSPANPALDYNQNLEPISFMQGLAPNQFNVSNLGSATFRHTENTPISQNQAGTFKMQPGNVLIETNRDTVISAKVQDTDCAIRLRANTIAHISLDEALKVQVLCDQGLHSVNLIAGKRSVILSAGQEAIVKPSKTLSRSLLAQDKLGRRKVATFALPTSEIELMTSEFSTVSLIDNTPLLKSVMNSRTSGERKLQSQVIKMGAILLMVTSSHGPYKALSSK
jgi:hypothetical protein